jgi:hypothetical protein
MAIVTNVNNDERYQYERSPTGGVPRCGRQTPRSSVKLPPKLAPFTRTVWRAVTIAGELGEALSGLVDRHRSVVDLSVDRLSITVA